MNQKRLTYLVGLAVVAIAFLIIIQLYWIRTSVDTQQKKFDQTVMEVMHSVVNKIEREEAATRVTSSIFDGAQLNELFGKDSVISIDGGLRKNEDGFDSPQQIVRTESDQLRLQFKKPLINDSSFLIIRETRTNVLSSTVRIEEPEPDPDSLLKTELKKKASLLSNIVNELALISISKNFQERIDYEKIDSLFSQELRANGIKTNYVFEVLDAETQLLAFSEDKTYNSAIKETPYRIHLFPNDFMESDALLLYFPDQESYVLRNSWKVLLTSFLLICILILLFYSSISTIYKQKRLSQVKNDFINNMTHELKTPISTISLACEALNDKSIALEKSKQDNYIGMINDENKRLSVLVDNVLKSAAWDSTSVKLDFRSLDLHELIKKVAKSFEIQVLKKGGMLNMEFMATKTSVLADSVHMSNVIYNLLDNANKYSKGSPVIDILTFNEGNKIVFFVKDQGIGISRSDQKKIFDKFYRVPTGNLHDVKGFGLGLSYVKRIIDLHAGHIELDSKKNIGTTITIKLENHG